MGQSFRVRTDINTNGAKDKNVTFKLNQDFDLLEILSLSLTQQDVYTRMCADFGVVVGRVVANGGFGIPNAKVSIFIPLDDKDEENEVIKFLYPFKQPFDNDEDGKRYNLLSSEKTFDCHVNVGTFPTLNNVLNKQEVKYVYEKYYRYTVKTNESGDFMIYGVPVGDQTIIMDVDVSDIGCFSLLPEDFKIKGFPDSDFDGPRFRDDRAIDSLPQVLNLQKSIDVRPFWGDEEFCRAAITRVDFDLSQTGFKLEPRAVFMGSTASDTDKDSVNNNCRPKANMGGLCSLISKPGIIDCVRYTPFFENDPLAYPEYTPGGWGAPLGGEVPILERYYLEDGGRVIDDSGSFLVHLPMNLDYMVTDEFGDMVLSDDPTLGVATRTRVRFRVRPEQATGGARQRRIGSHLVPNIREFYEHWSGDNNGDWPGIEASSYTFSTKYSDYHPWAQRNLIPAAEDVFYDMTFNRVYTYSQFHDHVKHSGRRQFVGIKEILPEMDQQCSTTAMFFPINSAVRSPNLMVFLWMFLIDFLGMFYQLIAYMVTILAAFLSIILAVVLVIIYILCVFWCFIYCMTISVWGTVIFRMTWILPPSAAPPAMCGSVNLNGFGCNAKCEFFGLRMGMVLFKLRQTKYPECEKCMCRTNVGNINIEDSMHFLTSNPVHRWPCPGDPPADPSNPPGGSTSSSCVPQCPPGNSGTGDDFGGSFNHDCCEETDEVRVCCDDNYGFNSDGSMNAQSTNVLDGIAGGGCYVKIICFASGCIDENLDMTVLRQWTRREKIAVALCNGIMNYFWENNWVSGFLYQFQFKAKLEYNNTTESYATNSQWCKKLTYLHPTEHTFYYRSTPFQVSGINLVDGDFIGDTDGVYSPWWAFNGNGSSDEHARGDMDRHILFPTTIVDMGSRNQCMQQICLDPKFSEECSITDQIGSTTFQDITQLVSDMCNIKMAYPLASMSTFFPRPEYEIGGDMAQALMQNCMLGVYGYETNLGNTACECDYVTKQSIMGNPPQDGGGLAYPSPNFTAGTYVDNAVNVNQLGGDNTFNHTILWEPILFTGQTQTIMDGQNLIDCVTEELNNSSQHVPYYPWRMRPAAPNFGFGDTWNDWLGTKGKYRYAFGVPGPAMSILPAIDAVSAWDVHVPASAIPLVYDGNFQNNMGNPPFSIANDNYPLLRPGSSKEIVFSQPLFYYFGLRPGATSFNTFVRKYIDEELADTVI